MKNEEDKSSNNIGNHIQTEKSLRMTTKENHPRKRAVQQAQRVGSDRRTKEVSRREISKNFFKKERKFEMTDYCY